MARSCGTTSGSSATTFAAHRGYEVDTQGDSFFVAFASARDALLAAVEGQRALLSHTWPEGAEIKVRMGLHTGQAVAHDGRYTGLAVHRAARIGDAGHGGQILASQATQTLLEDEEEDLHVSLQRPRRAAAERSRPARSAVPGGCERASGVLPFRPPRRHPGGGGRHGRPTALATPGRPSGRSSACSRGRARGVPAPDARVRRWSRRRPGEPRRRDRPGDGRDRRRGPGRDRSRPDRFRGRLGVGGEWGAGPRSDADRRGAADRDQASPAGGTERRPASPSGTARCGWRTDGAASSRSSIPSSAR